MRTTQIRSFDRPTRVMSKLDTPIRHIRLTLIKPYQTTGQAYADPVQPASNQATTRILANRPPPKRLPSSNHPARTRRARSRQVKSSQATHLLSPSQFASSRQTCSSPFLPFRFKPSRHPRPKPVKPTDMPPQFASAPTKRQTNTYPHSPGPIQLTARASSSRLISDQPTFPLIPDQVFPTHTDTPTPIQPCLLQPIDTSCPLRSLPARPIRLKPTNLA